jgi:hypothetical protein
MQSKYRQTPVYQLTDAQLRAQAEARFKKRQEMKADTPLAMREYREGEQALRDRMIKLRAERLARDAGRKS